MIVKMRKVYLVVQEAYRRDALERLRDLGVVHLKNRGKTNDTLENLKDSRSRLERAIAFLPKAPRAAELPAVDVEESLALADRVIGLRERERALVEDLERLDREQSGLLLWGDFDPDEVRALQEKGIRVTLYELTPEQYRRFPRERAHWVLGRTREAVRVVTVTLGEEENLPFGAAPLPQRSRAGIEAARAEKGRELEAVRGELENLSGKALELRAGQSRVQGMSEFEQARVDMELEGPLAYLDGYVPEDLVEPLRKSAAEHGWALLITDPAPDEEVPTLIRNPRWIEIIRPVFGLLETVPGYREYDISFWFLIFFSIFFAMLIGDAGYGFLFLGMTIFARTRLRRLPLEPFLLFYVLSICTIVWGALTGTWFGVEELSELPFLSWMIVPSISSWQNTATNIMLITFVIGAVHLSIAHGLNVVRYFPSLLSLGQLGWLIMVWGMFFVVRFIVLNLSLNPVAPWLVGIGFLLVILFEEQKGKFFKGLGIGLAKSPLKALNSISLFADIISYVRLFAVGLATLEIARAFNTIAASAGWGFPGSLISAFILLFGHSLNIMMGSLSIIVHGVRLNMLEFSGHLGMEWSGYPYRPFKK